MNRPRSRDAAALAAILLAAFALRVWGIQFGLPHAWARPDEEGIVVPALAIARGRFNPHWFDWPSLYMYIVGAAYWVYTLYIRVRGAAPPPDLLLLYVSHPQPFQLIDRGVSVAFGTLTVYLLYRLARAHFSRRTALTAAFFLALAPLAVRDAHFGVTDTAATCFAVAAVVMTLAWLRKPTALRLAAAAICCGLAASTKYNAGVVVIAGVSAVALQQDGQTGRRTAERLVALGTIATLAFLAGTPYAILDRAAFVEGLRRVRGHLSAGHGIDLGVGWIYHLHTTLPAGLGWPLFATAIAGAAWMAVARPRAALVLLSFPLMYYGVAGATRVVFFRHMLPVLPFCCLTAAFAVGRLPRRLSVVVAAAMMMRPTIDCFTLDRLLARTDTRTLAADWIRDRYPQGGTVFQSGAIYGHLGFVDPSFRDAPLGSRPDFIVIQDSPLMYSSDTSGAALVAKAEYSSVADFQGHDPSAAARNQYDPLDAFYLPLRGFRGIERPGPNITVYRKR